jgi:hypothetical protein
MFLERVLSFENGFNGFLNAVHQLPVVGTVITEDSYERNVPKKILSVVNFLVGLGLNFIGKLLYSVAFFLIPYLIMRNFVPGNSFNYEQTIENIFIMMNVICGSLIATAVLSDADEDYMLIHVMRMNPAKHYRGKIFYKLATDVLFFFMILWMFGIDAGISVMLAGMLLAARGIGELVRLFLYDKIPFLYRHILFLDVCVIIACVYFAYVSPYYHGYMAGLDALALSGGIYALILAAGFVCICLVWFYPKYDLLARQKIQYTDVGYQQQITTRAKIREAKSEMRTGIHVGRQDRKKGYSYLNALFFERCGNDVRRPVAARIYLLIILTAVCSLWLYLGNDLRRFLTWRWIGSLSVQLVCVMLLLSSAYKICRSVYYNCDRVMLEFFYYRNSETAVANFISRMIKIAAADLVTALVFCLAIGVVTCACGYIGSIHTLALIFGEIIALSLFFSAYETALYHLLQPYSVNLAVKEPLYYVGNAIIVAVAVFINLFHIAILPLFAATCVLDVAVFVGAYYLIKRYSGGYYKNK